MDILKIINMDNHRLLASAALFRGMYGEELDQYDVLGRFIEASVNLNGLHTFDVTECTTLLKKDFGFEIPEAVVRTCIRSKLKKQFERITGSPRWQRTANFTPDPTLLQSFTATQQDHEGLKLNLISHVESKYERKLSAAEQAQLIDDFHSHLIGSTRQNGNMPYIGHFILAVESDSPTKKILENTRQGLILFSGLRYSAEISGVTLPVDLTIFLDTEVLFSAVGYHGELRKQLFNDFLNLVEEINQKAKKTSGKILLRYFDQTANEVENYFTVAEAVINNRARLEPNKQAMSNIINGCTGGADVIAKKARFFIDLKKSKILKENASDYYDPPIYNIESHSAIQSLSSEIECTEEKASQVLKQFSRINFLRRGQSKTHLEAVRFILLSDKNVIRSGAFSKTVVDANNGGIPFATDLDYMTERIWFKLNKGFSSATPIPIAFDVVSRTQIVLSSQLGAKVANEYQQLIHENRRDGSGMTDEVLSYVVIEIMSKLRQPEEITRDNLDLDFLADDDYVAHVVADHSALKIAAEEGRETKKSLHALEAQVQLDFGLLNNEIENLQRENAKLQQVQEWKDARSIRRDVNKSYVQRAFIIYWLCRVLYWIVPICTMVWIIVSAIEKSDTRLSILSAFFTIIPVSLTGILWWFNKRFANFILRMKKNYLLRTLKRIDRRKDKLSSSNNGGALSFSVKNSGDVF